MPEDLHADGRTVVIGDIEITSPGLAGRVEVDRAPARRGMARSAPGDGALDAAVAQAGLRQQEPTITVDTAPVPAPPTRRGARAVRREPASVKVTVPAARPGQGQVMLVRDEDTRIVHWVLPDAPPAPRGRARGPATPPPTRTTFTLPVDEGPAGGRRGLIGAIGKKLLKVFAFDLLDKVTGKIANHFAAKWEAEAHPHRLRTFTPRNYRSPKAAALTAGKLAPYREGPTLLFVHGTMSLSHSGFQRIPPALMRDLHERYDGRVLAFDHPTVSVSPTENARWLAKLVGDAKLTVDIVAHSRGGLVSRVLAEQPDAAGIAPRSLSVRRLVMVGTPNQGTALADFDHLLDLADRISNVVDLIPDNAATDVFSIVISVVKQLAVGALNGLDGLVAMQPGGAWLAELNQARPVKTKYFGVSSNFEPPLDSPLAVIARDGVTDAIFANVGNDLVVPDEGVFGKNGATRFPIARPLRFTAENSVDHSSYWPDEAFAAKLKKWLIG